MPLKKLTKRRGASRSKRQSLATTFDQKCYVKKPAKVRKKPKRKSTGQNLRRSARIKSQAANTKAKAEKDTEKPLEDPAERDEFLNLTTPLQTPSSSNQPVPPKKAYLPEINFSCSLFGNSDTSSPSKHVPPVRRFETPTLQTSPQPPSNHKRRKQSNLNSALQKRNHNVLYLGDEPQDHSNEESVLGFPNPFLKEDSKNLPAPMKMKIDLQSMNTYYNVKLVGQGSFGKVFQGVNSANACIYAIKKLPVQSTSQKSRALALKESHVLSSLTQHGNCPYIVQYYSTFWESDSTVCVQMEFCANGNVRKRHSERRLIEAEIWKLFTQISKAIHFLHSHNIAHLDVKPENMLIHANGDYRLADFGHATFIECSSRKGVFQVEEGDSRYLAYELLQDDFTHLGAADIFSLSLSMIELLTDSLPHNGEEWKALRQGKMKRNLNCRKEFKTILKNMMKADPSKRTTPKVLLKEIARRDHLYMSD